MKFESLNALVVDDEPHIRQYLALILRSIGIEKCAEAGDLATARRAHADTQRDVVLLDANLPGGSGLEFLRELRSAGDEAVVVIVSSLSSAGLVREAVDLGADGFLRKDMPRDELVAELTRILNETLGD